MANEDITLWKAARSFLPSQILETLSDRHARPRVFVPSAVEGRASDDPRHTARMQECIDSGVRAGFYNAAWAAALTTPPTIILCRTVPWAKVNLNHTAQALIISSAAIAAYFIASEQTIMACTHRKSMENIRELRRVREEKEQAKEAKQRANEAKDA